MSFDALLMFSQNQQLLATANSTDVLDLGQPSINPRSPTGARFPVVQNGTDPAVVIKVTETFAGSTGLNIALQGSNDNATFVQVGATTPPFASLVAGAELGIAAGPNIKYRYLRLVYVVTGTGTAGRVTAGMADGYQTAGYV